MRAKFRYSAHPGICLVIAGSALAFCLVFCFLSDGVNLMFGGGVDFAREETTPENNERVPLLYHLYFGKPWVALAVGLTLGTLWWLRAKHSDRRNLDGLVEKLLSSRVMVWGPDSWKGSIREWAIALAMMAALIALAIAGRFSFKIAALAMIVPMPFTYSEHRFVYEKALARFVAEKNGADIRALRRRANWLVSLLAALMIVVCTSIAYWVTPFVKEMRMMAIDRTNIPSEIYDSARRAIELRELPGGQ